MTYYRLGLRFAAEKGNKIKKGAITMKDETIRRNDKPMRIPQFDKPLALLVPASQAALSAAFWR